MLKYPLGIGRSMPTTLDRRIRYAVLIAAAGMHVLTLIFFVGRLSTPSDGAQLWLRTQNTIPNVIAITPLIEQADGLQVNDRVSVVDGQPVTYWADMIFDPASVQPPWNFNQTVIYTVIRDNQSLEIAVKLREYPLGRILRENLGIILFLVTVQAGAAWVFIKRPDERTTQTLFLAACAVVTFSLCWFLGMDLAAFIKVKWLWLYYRLITIVLVTLMCSALLHFALLIPQLNIGRGVQRQLVWLIYAAPYGYYVLYVLLVYTPDKLEWLRRWELSWWLLFDLKFGRTPRRGVRLHTYVNFRLSNQLMKRTSSFSMMKTTCSMLLLLTNVYKC